MGEGWEGNAGSEGREGGEGEGAGEEGAVPALTSTEESEIETLKTASYHKKIEETEYWTARQQTNQPETILNFLV